MPYFDGCLIGICQWNKVKAVVTVAQTTLVTLSLSLILKSKKYPYTHVFLKGKWELESIKLEAHFYEWSWTKPTRRFHSMWTILKLCVYNILNVRFQPGGMYKILTSSRIYGAQVLYWLCTNSHLFNKYVVSTERV